MILIRWYWESGLHIFGLGETNLLLTYHVASASIFEPRRSKERIAWTKTAALVKSVEMCLSSHQDKLSFLQEMKFYSGDHSPSYMSMNGVR